MTRTDLENILILAGFSAIVGMIAGIAEYESEKNQSKNTYQFLRKRRANVDYYDVVNCIMESDLYSYQKSDLIEQIKIDGNSAYYNTIIKVLKSKMWNYEKIEIIENLSKK